VTELYTNISDLIARKEAGRREAARRSFAEKIAMVEALRERAQPLKEMREQNRRSRRGRTGDEPA
jgi:hypothetical protein